MKLFFSYLLVLTIPIMLMILIYFMAISAISKSSDERANSILTQVQTITDTKLKELDGILLSLKNNPEILKFVRKEDIRPHSEDYYQLYKVIKNIPNYKITNSVVEQIHVFAQKSNCVLGTNWALKFDEGTYASFFNASINEYDTFLDILWGRNYFNEYVIMNTEEIDGNQVYLFSNILEVGSFGNSIALVTIELNNQFFLDMLSKVEMNHQGGSFIVDEKGNLISSYVGNLSTLGTEFSLQEIAERGRKIPLAINNQSVLCGKMDMGEYLINIVESPYNGWTYYSVLPRSVLMENVYSVGTTMIVTVIAAIVFGLFACYIISKHNSKPLRKIIGYLNAIYQEQLESPLSELKFIESAIHSIVDTNSLLTQKIQHQKPLVDTAMLQKIFTGQAAKEDLPIDLDKNSFVVIHVSIIYSNSPLLGAVEIDAEDDHILMGDYLHEMFGENIFIAEIDQNNLELLILSGNHQNIVEFEQCVKCSFEDFGLQFLHEKRVKIEFFVSNAFEGVGQVKLAYDQVKKIAENVIRKTNKFLYNFSDLPGEQSLYIYPIDQELKLIQLIKCGNINQLKALLEEIMTVNFHQSELSESMKLQLMYAMKNTLFRSLKEFRVSDEIEEILHQLNHTVNTDRLFNLLVRVSVELCRVNSMSTDDSVNRKKESILALIQENYSDCNYNISCISEKMDMSEKGTYQFFKEVIGISFYDILESTRIQEACKLLTKEEVNIKQIAELVGYQSDSSFRRAFKRVLGMSPTEYLKCNSKKTI